MKKFKCHKVVEAVQLDVVGPLSGAHVEVEAGGETFYLDQEWVRRHKPEAGGYLVRYADGYESFSPKDVFEAGYHEISEDEPKFGDQIGAVEDVTLARYRAPEPAPLPFFPDAPTISTPINTLVNEELKSAMGIQPVDAGIRGAGSAAIPTVKSARKKTAVVATPAGDESGAAVE